MRFVFREYISDVWKVLSYFVSVVINPKTVVCLYLFRVFFFYVIGCTVVWKKLGDEFNADTHVYNFAGFNQRRRGYVLIGEGKSQEIEGEERLT